MDFITYFETDFFELLGDAIKRQRQGAAIVLENISDMKSLPASFELGGLRVTGGDLLSHEVSLAVPSALKSLTSVFGMGTGVTSSPWPPKSVWNVMTIGWQGIELLGCSVWFTKGYG